MFPTTVNRQIKRKKRNFSSTRTEDHLNISSIKLYLSLRDVVADVNTNSPTYIYHNLEHTYK